MTVPASEPPSFSKAVLFAVNGVTIPKDSNTDLRSDISPKNAYPVKNVQISVRSQCIYSKNLMRLIFLAVQSAKPVFHPVRRKLLISADI